MQQIIKLLPAPAEYRQLSIYLELPDIHHCLLDIIQISGLNIKCTDAIQKIRLFTMLCFPPLQHRESMQDPGIKILLPDIRLQRQRQQMFSPHILLAS